jgi:hypothetical protein
VVTLSGRCAKINLAEISSEPKCIPKARRSPIRNPGAKFFKADITPLDVSGKGLKAAMAVSLIVGLVQAFAPIVEDPGELLGKITVLTLTLAAAEAARA